MLKVIYKVSLESEAKFDAIIGDFKMFVLFAVAMNMPKQNVKKK